MLEAVVGHDLELDTIALHEVTRDVEAVAIQVDGEMFAYPRDNVRQVTITSLPAAIQVMV